MSLPRNEVEYFRACAGDNLLREWLEAQKVEAVRMLAEATDMRVIGANQQKYRFATQQLALMDQAKSLR